MSYGCGQYLGDLNDIYKFKLRQVKTPFRRSISEKYSQSTDDGKEVTIMTFRYDDCLLTLNFTAWLTSPTKRLSRVD